MKKILALAAIVAMSILVVTLPAYASASAASTSFSPEGGVAYGLVFRDENSLLLQSLDIELNNCDYAGLDDIVQNGINSTLTLRYTLQATAESDESSTLYLPSVGTTDYNESTDDDSEYFRFSDKDKYGVKINGEATSLQQRFSAQGQSGNDMSENISAALSGLSNGKITDGYYNSNLKVFKHVYTVSSETDDSFVILLPVDMPKGAATIICGEDDPEYTTLYAEGTIWVKNGCVLEVYFIENDDADFASSVTFQTKTEDFKGSPEAVEANLTESSEATMTFEEFLQIGYNAEHGISQDDWFNAAVRYAKSTSASNMMMYMLRDGWFEENLVCFYEFGLNVDSGETVEVEVTMPIYPTVETYYSPNVLRYTCNFNLNGCWSGSAQTTFTVNTSYYLSNVSHVSFEKNESGGYSEQRNNYFSNTENCRNLVFELCSSESPEYIADEDIIPVFLRVLLFMLYIGFLGFPMAVIEISGMIVILLGMVVLLILAKIVLVIVFVVRDKKRRRKKEEAVQNESAAVEDSEGTIK